MLKNILGYLIKKLIFNTDTLYYLLDLATDKGIKGLLAQHGRAIG